MALDFMQPGMHNRWIINLVLQLTIFIAFIVIVWWLAKGSQRIKEKPLDILKRRLASGEITIKEFEKLKKEIE